MELQLFREILRSSPVPILSLLLEVELLGLGEERPHLGLELLLSDDQPSEAHRLVFGGIGPDLGAVEGHATELDETDPLGDLQSLDEQSLEDVEVLLTKAGNGVVVRVLVGGEVAKGHILVGGAFDLPGGAHTDRVSVDQELGEHLGVESGGAALGVLVTLKEGGRGRETPRRSRR